MTNYKLLTLIETVLGKGRSTNKGNVAFHCPFCHHNKKKLEVNILQTQKGLAKVPFLCYNKVNAHEGHLWTSSVGL